MTNPVKSSVNNSWRALNADVEAVGEALAGSSTPGGGPVSPARFESPTGLARRGSASQRSESPANLDEHEDQADTAIPLSARGKLQDAEDKLKGGEQSVAILEKAASKSLKAYAESSSHEGHCSATGHLVATATGNSVGIYGTRNLMGYGVSTVADVVAGGPGNIWAAAAAGAMKPVLGIGTAALGQTIHQNVTTPAINRSFQHHYVPVSDGALMTTKKRDRLNALSKSGKYGDELAAKNKKIRDNSFDKGFHSDFSSKVFATGAALSAVAQWAIPNTREGTVAKLATIVGTSTFAGAMVGGRLARSAAANRVAVPRKRPLEVLEERVGAGNATDADLAAVPTRQKNVGYPRKMSAAEVLEKNTKAENGRPKTIEGKAESFGNKWMELNRGLFPSNVAQAVGTMVATGLDDAVGQIAVIAAANAGGMGTSVPAMAAATTRMAAKDKEIRAGEDGYAADLVAASTQPLMETDNVDMNANESV